MWLQRNLILHEQISNKELTKKRKQLDKMIKDEFNIGKDDLRQHNKGFINVKKAKVQ